MTRPLTPNKPPKRVSAEYYRGSSYRLVDQAVQIRLCDLLHYLKRPRERVSGISFTLGKIRIKATLDLSDLERPIVTINTASTDGDFGEPQTIPLRLRHAPFGGWTADFVCPLMRKDGSTCGRMVQSLYLPEPWAESLFGCRKCHRLEYSCRVRRKFRYPRAWKRRKKSELKTKINHRRSRAVEAIPPFPPDARWFDNIVYTEEELFRIKLMEALRSPKSSPEEYLACLKEAMKVFKK
jgi:hypothetical protein